MKRKRGTIAAGGLLFFLAAAMLLVSFDSLKFTFNEQPSQAAVGYTVEDNEIIVKTDSAVDANIGVSAQSAILIDGLSGNVLYEKNAYKRLPMASTTKVMTAIVALESGVPLDRLFKITKEMTGVEGSSIYLYEGEMFTLEDLIYAVLLNSANDAATAVAICVAGSVEKFAEMMNEKAKQLGLKDSNFMNPHGLDHELHYTTAYDLAVISAYSLKNDKFKEITSAKTHIIYSKKADGSKSGEGTRYLRNHNRMLNFYEGAIGVKTGFTKRSGRCLVSAAEREDVRLVAVTINAPSDWADHRNMLDFGFTNYKSIVLCDEGELQYYVDVVNGTETDENGETTPKSKVLCTNTEKVYASFPKHINIEDIEIVAELPKFIYAPVSTNDVIGRVVYYHNGEKVGSTPLVSAENAEIVIEKSIADKIREFFTGKK